MTAPHAGVPLLRAIVRVVPFAGRLARSDPVYGSGVTAISFRSTVMVTDPAFSTHAGDEASSEATIWLTAGAVPQFMA